MRKLFALLIFALPAWSAVAFDNYKDGGYGGAGVHTTTIVASGTNIGCLVITWSRSGTDSSPSCGGVGMGAAVSTQTTTQCLSSATQHIYYVAGLSAGTLTASISNTVESDLQVVTVNGAASAVDVVTSLVSGTQDGSGNAVVPITTVANNTLAIGVYCSGTALNNTPSSNSTRIGRDGTVGFDFWRSTSLVTPAGAFNITAKAASPGNVFEGVGVSIGPPSAPPSTVPRRRVFIQ